MVTGLDYTAPTAAGTLGWDGGAIVTGLDDVVPTAAGTTKNPERVAIITGLDYLVPTAAGTTRGPAGPSAVASTTTTGHHDRGHDVHASRPSATSPRLPRTGSGTPRVTTFRYTTFRYTRFRPGSAFRESQLRATLGPGTLGKSQLCGSFGRVRHAVSHNFAPRLGWAHLQKSLHSLRKR